VGGPTHLAVGLLKKPHGVKGDALVYPMTDEPESVFRAGRRLWVLDREGRPTLTSLVVRRGRAYQRAWLVHFEGIDGRAELDALRERHLAIEIGEARPLEPGEFYLHELVGLAVERHLGGAVGTVTRVAEAPSGVLLEVKGEGREHLVPFVPGVIRRVDREQRVVVIDPPEGLLEL
jgi:16S rRNA processing protein RimM